MSQSKSMQVMLSCKKLPVTSNLQTFYIITKHEQIVRTNWKPRCKYLCHSFVDIERTGFNSSEATRVKEPKRQHESQKSRNIVWRWRETFYSPKHIMKHLKNKQNSFLQYFINTSTSNILVYYLFTDRLSNKLNVPTSGCWLDCWSIPAWIGKNVKKCQLVSVCGESVGDPEPRWPDWRVRVRPND